MNKSGITVKGIANQRYSITVVESLKGSYFVQVEKPNSTYQTHSMKDYNLASSVFDRMLRRLEGN